MIMKELYSYKKENIERKCLDVADDSNLLNSSSGGIFLLCHICP